MSPFKEYLANKTVVVTGAGKGVGRALATELHRLGSEVYAVTRTQADLDTLVKECPKIHPIQLDISDWDATKNTLNAKLPPTVDVLVNNAAVIDMDSHLQIDSDSFDRVMNTNVKAVINITQVCVSKMIAQKTEGIVINVSSVGAIRPLATNPVYCASKAALDALTKTMAVEFGKHKIRVLGLNAGVVYTNMGGASMLLPEDLDKLILKMFAGRHPLGKSVIPMEDVVNTLLFMASGIAGMMTGNGVILDGGYTAT